MEYIFIFTIGPVQPFIEKSRKARDMYAGSKILSGLMEYAMEWIKNKNWGDIIFPKPMQESKDSASSIPNRLIAKVKTEQEQEQEQIAKELSNYINHKFVTNAIESLKNVGIPDKGLQLAKRQCEHFLEIYWLFEKNENDNYMDTYKRLFANLNAVKNIRMFSQINEPWGRKCQLFPEYNAIFAKRNERGDFPWNSNQDAVCDITGVNKLQYLIKSGEAVSALALIKRVYETTEKNIVSIRQMLMKSRVSETMMEKVRMSYSDDLANALYDLANGNVPRQEEYEPNFVDDAAKLWECLQKEKKVKLAFYYALVKFDGDDMGNHFIEKETEEAQQELSKNIGEFAKKVPEIIQTYQGMTIFAGGEDFFGILPLETLFDCLVELNNTFYRMVKLKFSAGVAVGHVMQPLKQVVSMADRMEKAAKSKEGKHSFVIGILKRAGEKVQTPACKLEEGTGDVCLSDFDRLLHCLTDSEYSKSFVFGIIRMFRHFEKERWKPCKEMAEVLIRKIVRTSCINEPNQSQERFVSELVALYEKSSDISAFIATLNALAFLKREVEMCTI